MVKNHNSNNKIVSVTVYTEYNKNWSYDMKPGCKNKYEKNHSKPPMYQDYIVPHGERDNISIQRSPSPLIQSQYVSPISSGFSLLIQWNQ